LTSSDISSCPVNSSNCQSATPTSTQPCVRQRRHNIPWTDVSNALNLVTGFALILTGFSLIRLLKTRSVVKHVTKKFAGTQRQGIEQLLFFRKLRKCVQSLTRTFHRLPFQNITNRQPCFAFRLHFLNECFENCWFYCVLSQNICLC